jgi:seryl-tRNA synthetase
MKLKENRSLVSADLKDYGEKRLNFLTNYLAVTKNLSARSSPNDLSEILKLLNQRQKIINDLSSLDSLREELLGDKNKIADAQKEKYLSISLKIKEILSEIEYLDKKFISWRDGLKEELTANQLNLKTLHTYAQSFKHQQASPRFLDLRR